MDEVMLHVAQYFEAEVDADYAESYGLPIYTMESALELANVPLGLIEIE
jgi:hypothetical protein